MTHPAKSTEFQEEVPLLTVVVILICSGCADILHPALYLEKKKTPKPFQTVCWGGQLVFILKLQHNTLKLALKFWWCMKASGNGKKSYERFRALLSSKSYKVILLGSKIMPYMSQQKLSANICNPCTFSFVVALAFRMKTPTSPRRQTATLSHFGAVWMGPLFSWLVNLLEPMCSSAGTSTAWQFENDNFPLSIQQWNGWLISFCLFWLFFFLWVLF